MRREILNRVSRLEAKSPSEADFCDCRLVTTDEQEREAYDQHAQAAAAGSTRGLHIIRLVAGKGANQC